MEQPRRWGCVPFNKRWMAAGTASVPQEPSEQESTFLSCFHSQNLQLSQSLCALKLPSNLGVFSAHGGEICAHKVFLPRHTHTFKGI